MVFHFQKIVAMCDASIFLINSQNHFWMFGLFNCSKFLLTYLETSHQQKQLMRLFVSLHKGLGYHRQQSNIRIKIKIHHRPNDFYVISDTPFPHHHQASKGELLMVSSVVKRQYLTRLYSLLITSPKHS